jgi:hypothetical protein
MPRKKVLLSQENGEDEQRLNKNKKGKFADSNLTAAGGDDFGTSSTNKLQVFYVLFLQITLTLFFKLGR